MYHLRNILLLLGACVSAMPTEGNKHSNMVRSDAAQPDNAVIAACKTAENCETYTDQKGYLRPRFKKGMGPGSAHYTKSMSKRDDSPTTHLNYGAGTLIWGCNIDPMATAGNSTVACPPGGSACDTNPVSIPIQYLNPSAQITAPQAQTLTLIFTGQFPVWAEAAFTTALSLAANQGINWQRNVAWASESPSSSHFGMGPSASGTCDLATATDFIEVTTYNGNNLEGSISVQVTLPTEGNGFCNDQGMINSLATAFFGALPGAGPALAGIFGAVNAICTAVTAPAAK